MDANLGNQSMQVLKLHWLFPSKKKKLPPNSNTNCNRVVNTCCKSESITSIVSQCIAIDTRPTYLPSQSANGKVSEP